jgi:hypothetical protein
MIRKLSLFVIKQKKSVIINSIFIIVAVFIGIVIFTLHERGKKPIQELSEFFEEYKQMHITTEHHRMMYYTKRVSVNPDEIIDIRYMDMDDAEEVLREYHEFGRENKDILLVGFRNDNQHYIEFSSETEGVSVEITFPDKIVKRENIVDTNDTLKALRIYWTLMSS